MTLRLNGSSKTKFMTDGYGEKSQLVSNDLNTVSRTPNITFKGKEVLCYTKLILLQKPRTQY